MHARVRNLLLGVLLGLTFGAGAMALWHWPAETLFGVWLLVAAALAGSTLVDRGPK